MSRKIKNLINLAMNDKSREFEENLKVEINARIHSKMQEKRQEIASTMFKESTANAEE